MGAFFPYLLPPFFRYKLCENNICGFTFFYYGLWANALKAPATEVDVSEEHSRPL